MHNNDNTLKSMQNHGLSWGVRETIGIHRISFVLGRKDKSK